MNKNKTTNRTIYQKKRLHTVNAGTIAAAVILLGIACLCVSGTACGRGKGAYSEDAAYCRQIEKAYVSRARSVMDSEGYRNSGITMTHLVDEAGVHTYIVKLHHERLAKTTKERKAEIYEALSSIDFADGEVLYEFI